MPFHLNVYDEGSVRGAERLSNNWLLYIASVFSQEKIKIGSKYIVHGLNDHLNTVWTQFSIQIEWIQRKYKT